MYFSSIEKRVSIVYLTFHEKIALFACAIQSALIRTN